MIEIMGGNLDLAFEEFEINAKKLVETESGYQVWELSEKDFEELCAVDNKDWNHLFGWWRSGRCIYEGSADFAYEVNGHRMFGYEPAGDVFTTTYSTYTEWLNEVMNLSNDKNTVIFAESLATDNGLKLSEFIAKYEK